MRRFEVRDDGRGFAEDEVTGCAGITDMRDRLAAVGGTLTVHCSPGHGARVTRAVPLS